MTSHSQATGLVPVPSAGGAPAVTAPLAWCEGRFRIEPVGAVPVGQRDGRPARPGFLLHSLLGLGLRRVACLESPPCSAACRNGECSYGRLWEMRPAGPRTERDAFATSPLAIDAPWTWWRPGRALEFGIVVLGGAAASRDAVERAVGWMAEHGFEHAHRLAHAAWRESRLDPDRHPGRRGLVGLRFLTPVRLLRRGQPQRTLSFEDIARDVAFRVGSWWRHHQGSDTPPLWPAIESEVRETRVLRASQRWADSLRHSTRQGRPVPAGGVLGEMTLAHVSPRLRGLLAAAQVCGIGKGATSGLGRVRVWDGEDA